MSQHRAQRPEVDLAPLAVVGRLVRVSRLLDQSMRAMMLGHGVEPWEFDVLASLRRSPPPHVLTAGSLGHSMILSPGALTNRVDRLVTRGLVTRDVDPDNRRQVLIGLTDQGQRLVEPLLAAVADHQRQLLAGLSPAEQADLAGSLRRLLLSLGDRPVVGGRPGRTAAARTR